MIGVNPPGHFLYDSTTTDEQIAHYADLCAKDASCRQRTDDLAASMRRTAAHMPDRWLFFPVDKSSVRVATFFALAESTSKAGLSSAPATFDSWLAAANGDPSGLWLQALVADLIVPGAFVWGEYADAGTLDAQAARDYFSSDLQAPNSIDYAG